MIEEKYVYFDQGLNLGACLLYNIIQCFPSHYHEYYVIGLLEKGTRLLTYKTSKYMLTPQSLLLLNPGDSHRCTANDIAPSCYRALHIPISTMQNLMYDATGCAEIPYFSKPVVENNNLNLLFMKIHTLILSSTSSDNKCIKRALNTFIKLLSDNYINYAEFSQNYNPKIMQARQYIDDNYMKKIKIKQICKDIDISPTTLFVYFLHDIGISPRRYLLAKKVNAAQKLLPDMCVQMVAAKLGFFDHSHFTRSFKSIMGITPIQYKHLLKKSQF